MGDAQQPAADGGAGEERDRRLARLQRLSAALINSYRDLLAAAPVNDAPAASDVDTARLRAASSSLVANVEGLLALIRELRLDVFVQGLSAEASPSSGAAAGGPTGVVAASFR